MIITVTPNPSVDRLLEIDGLARGEVHRVRGRRDDAGGKGVNVAGALLAAGVPTRCVVPWGGDDGADLRRLITDAGLDVIDVRLRGMTRVNLSLTEPDGTVTKVNEAGPELSADEVDALLAAIAGAAAGASWVVTAGSLPPGAPVDLHAEIVRIAHAAGARAAVDTAGPALLAALAAGPDLIKPNREELATATGETIVSLADAVAAAQTLRRRGAVTVLASLGADGAVLVDDQTPVHASAAVTTPRSTVGAGDATLAGYLAGIDLSGDRVAALRRAVAFGAAAVALPGTRMPGPSDLDLDAVRVTDRIDHDSRAAASITATSADVPTAHDKGETR